ncbi:MAG: hypothetical protein PARBA_01169 [Parabacteroides sp.]
MKRTILTIYKNENRDVIGTYNDNDYWLYLNDKFVKFKNEKSLLKLFPQKEEAIRNYIKEYKNRYEKPRTSNRTNELLFGMKPHCYCDFSHFIVYLHDFKF